MPALPTCLCNLTGIAGEMPDLVLEKSERALLWQQSEMQLTPHPLWTELGCNGFDFSGGLKLNRVQIFQYYIALTSLPTGPSSQKGCLFFACSQSLIFFPSEVIQPLLRLPLGWLASCQSIYMVCHQYLYFCLWFSASFDFFTLPPKVRLDPWKILAQLISLLCSHF